MIKLAMEIPTCRLREWSPLADLDFILAHQVLADSAYAEFFKNRVQGRELILDNSYHELGYPLSMSDLQEAARQCRADYVISPDKVNEPEWNVQQFRFAKEALRDYKIAVVFQGAGDSSTALDRERFLEHVKSADMLCPTFKEKHRYDWWNRSPNAGEFRRIHLLGVSELSELRRWQVVARLFPNISWSVDTGKALKWALKDKYLDQLVSLRTSAKTTSLGLPSEVSQRLLELKDEELSVHVEKVFRRNVEILKECCK